MATIPAAATTGPIQVSTADGTATSTIPFIVTAASDLAVSNTVSTCIRRAAANVDLLNRGHESRPVNSNRRDGQDTLPTGAKFISAISPRGTCSVTNGIVTCNLGILTNGTAVELTVQAESRSKASSPTA